MRFPRETEQYTDQTSPASPPTRAHEAISQYPIARDLITHLARKDIYNLILSHPAIYYKWNTKNLRSLRNVLERCIRTCPGPPPWGAPEVLYFIKPEKHKALERDPNEDMDVQMCAREGCFRDSCKHCRQFPPVRSETRRRWICPECLPPKFPNPCTCTSAANIYCQECAVETAIEDEAWYDFKDYSRADRMLPRDRNSCKRPECVDYYYSCWECGAIGEILSDGLFMCSWCWGRVGYADLHPRDIRSWSSQSCAAPVEAVGQTEP